MKSYVGIDWSQSKHNVVVLNEQGVELLKKEVAHNRAGFEQLGKLLQQVNPVKANCLVIIETEHNQLVDYLWDQQYPLYVLAPSVVTGNRSRQTNSGARNDDSDAKLLADILRTDQGRLVRWQADTIQVRQLRGMCSLVDDLTTSIVRYHNRLDALLRRHYLQPRLAFKDLTVPTWLHWLEAHPSPTALANSNYKEFEAFCWQHGHRRRPYLVKAWAILQQPAPFAAATPLATEEIQHIAALMLVLVKRKARLLRSIGIVVDQHQDAAIFRSLPGVGDLLSAKLLTMFGDQRPRWPTRNALQQVAGTCPATSQSGKRSIIFFRNACNHAFRNTMQQVAMQSVKQSDWAATYHAQALARGLSASHAYRCLANRWLAIIWTLWQRRVPYDAAIHLQHIAQRRRA